MEDQHHKAPTSVSTLPAASLPSIGTLFTDSWHTVTKSMLNLFLLTLIALGGGFLWGLGFMVFTLLSAAGLIMPFTKGNTQFTPESLLTMLGGLGVVLLLFAVGIFLLILFAVAIQAAEMVVIDQYAQTVSVWGSVKKGFSKALALVIVGMLMFLIIFGGFLFFIIPGIVFAILFMFVSYEIVLSNNSIWGSIKRSTAIVLHNFGGIFVRFLLFFLLSIVISASEQYVMGYSDSSMRMPGLGLSIIVNVLFGWYSLAYSITLYKQSRAVTPADKSVNMVWILIISFLGWLMFIGVIYAGYKALSQEPFKSAFAGMMRSKQQQEQVAKKENLVYVPSVCGVEAALPATKDTYKGEKRQWTYDEVTFSNESFRAVDPKVMPIQNAQGTTIWYKDPKGEILEGNTYLTFPGIEIMCIDNTRGLTFDTYKGLVLANRGVEVKTSDEKPYITGDGVKLQYVLISGKTAAGKIFEDPAYIGVSKDGKKLLYIRFWPAGKGDPKTKKINADQDLIFSTLRYGATGNLLIPTIQQTTRTVAPQQTYVAPTIKPGELGSKEWKEEFDRKFQEAQKATGN